MKTKVLLSLTALAAGLFAGGCSRQDMAPREITRPARTAAVAGGDFAGNVILDSETFRASIKASVEGKTTGYCFDLLAGPNTTFLYNGYAAGLTKFTTGTRMETAQLSSTLSAIALLKVLEGKPGLTVDSPVHPYLPSDWALGPNVKLLTFRHLLTHRSGLTPELVNLTEPATDLYDNLKLLIGKGIVKDQVTKVNGKPVLSAAKRELSANYALLRILIPYLHNGAPVYKPTETMGRNAEATARDYVKLVTEKVFHPSGIVNVPVEYYVTPDVFPTHSDGMPGNVYTFTHYYTFGSATLWWEQDKLGRQYAGYNRWYMSAHEYVTVVHKLWNGHLLSDASLQLLKSESIALSAVSGKQGTYYYHQGGMVKQGRGFATAFMLFPNGAAAVLFVNSVGGMPNNEKGYPDLYKVLQQAYEDAVVNASDL
ncbi:MAG: beta-lactamase family protein [Cytophagales bacterium]|nr:beta-lactamase family protein [Cytophagales bacterium]